MTITTRFTGAFKDDPALMDRFLKLAKAVTVVCR